MLYHFKKALSWNVNLMQASDTLNRIMYYFMAHLYLLFFVYTQMQ